MSSSPINLLLTTKMFEEDNYQLVDYQSQQYEKNTFEIKSSGIIYEQMNQIYFSEIDNNEELEPYELFTIKSTNNEYFLNIKTIIQKKIKNNSDSTTTSVKKLKIKKKNKKK